MAVDLSRRGALQLLGGAGLSLAFSSSAFADGPAATLADWVQIAPNGAVTLFTSVQEMGQGAWCAHARILAEELGLDWNAVRVEQAPPLPAYGIFAPNYATGGSASVREMFDRLRRAGAAARTMLVETAAERWAVAAASCETLDGSVRHPASGRSETFGALAEAAARRPVPQDPVPKRRQEWSVIGKDFARKDLLGKVDGTALYATDLALPGLLTATILQAPTFGDRLAEVDASPALAVPGVRHVLKMQGVEIQAPGVAMPITLPDAVVVVADSFWSAQRGREALQPRWKPGAPGRLDTAGLHAELKRHALEQAEVATPRGDEAPDVRLARQHAIAEKTAEALATADRVIEAEYALPLLSHAQMEPLSAVARVTSEGAEAWGGFQNTGGFRRIAAALLGVGVDRITAHTMFSGGSFGRRYKNDFGIQALWIAQAVGGPVKLVWTREEDFRQGWYRPASYQRFRAGLDKDGQVTALRVDGAQNNANYTAEMGEGLPRDRLFYELPNLCLAGSAYATPIPGGPWRSVLHSGNAFGVECFLDELALAANVDPVLFRRRLCRRDDRAVRTLERAAAMSGWGRKTPPGHGLGVALWRSFGTYCAQVVEVMVKNGQLKILDVWCAVDPGTALFPDGIRAQAEGSIIMALSSAATGEVNLQDGRVLESNFHDYPLMTMAQTPRIHVEMLETPEAPVGGIGEPMTPPAMPALANAIFAATGVRHRSLPLSRAGLSLI